AGSVADIVNRRKIMAISGAGMAVIGAVLAILTFRGTIQLWVIYLAIGLMAVSTTFEQPARQAVIPNLVPAEDLHNAFSMQVIGSEIGALTGPILSGLLIGRVGQYSPYLVASFFFAGMIGLLAAIGPIAQEAEPDQARARVTLSAIRQGIRFTVRNPLILSSMLLDFFATLLTGAGNLMPIIARDILHVGAEAYGFLSAAVAIGATAAAAVLTQFKTIRRQGVVLLVSVGLIAVGTILFGLSRSFLLTMAALILIGASDSVSAVIRNTIRQLQTPDRLRGRVVSVNQIFFMGGPQLGELRAGVVAQLTTVPFAIISGGIACLAALAWADRRWPELRA
ncbi:MAG TPA: MFS transporter, partial [Anaerolineales bacterium]|nr:MFS transporter [Anaerolineales bacterium]